MGDKGGKKDKERNKQPPFTRGHEFRCENSERDECRA